MSPLRLRTVLLVIGCGAFTAAFIAGISDNPPGIALLYGGLVCLTLAVVFNWRRPKSFLLLFALSAIGFVVFAILHNLLYAIGHATDLAWLRGLMEALHVAAFLIAILVCPVGLVVGLVGWIAVLIRNRRDPTPGVANPPVD